jgi:hypothetical protein
MNCDRGKCKCRNKHSVDESDYRKGIYSVREITIEEWKATRKRLHSTQSNLAAEFLEDRVGWVYLYGIDGRQKEYPMGYIEITGSGYEVPLERHTEVYDHLFRAEEVLYGWLKNERLLYE